MYNKQEASVLKHAFWTSFGQYLSPVPSSEGLKISWVNYKTGVKDLYFRMEAGSTSATVNILITHADRARQALFFNLFKQLQPVLRGILQEEWQWELQVPGDNGKTVSRIYTELGGVSVYKKDDWPLIISFLKPRIMALDKFWNEVKFGFAL